MSIFHRIISGIQDAAYIWRQEMKQAFKDEGVLIFFIIVPLIYPLLYSWIYNNEVVHEVPVVVVDDCHSGLSRELVRKLDASADVKVLCHAADMDEARSLVSRQLAKGIYYIPSDFATRLNRMEQATLSVYCDMSLMLTYKAIYQTAVNVTQYMGAEMQKKLSGKYTVREEQIQARPLDFQDVPIFNPQGGYGTFVIPAVLMLIFQQTLVLGIGLAAGTVREKSHYGDLVPIHPAYGGIYRIVFGKSLCYIMIYAVMGAYLTLVVPRIFSFVTMVKGMDLLCLMIPYLLACVFFGMTVSCLECNAAYGVHLAATALHGGHLLAPERHSRRMAGRFLAVPQHLWSPCLCTYEHYGCHPWRCNHRGACAVDSGSLLFRSHLPGIWPPVARGSTPCS